MTDNLEAFIITVLCGFFIIPPITGLGFATIEFVIRKWRDKWK